MAKVVVLANRIGKRYQIGSHQRFDSVRDTLASMAANSIRKLKNVVGRKTQISSSENYIWALRDVSFEIFQGDVVGLIGRNGAGKSTVLKILSRITRPSEGYAEVYGRVGSLLEVGTGFHPDLTGRENIFLSGSILGMKRKEITRRFDEIVTFSEIGKFIDTQVKFYSSGMYMRLAFAVAINMEPDILFIDEVLAVGDLAFQKKCLDRLEYEAKIRNTTAVYVSHNISTIKSLCTKVIYLENGQLVSFGPANEVCSEYIQRISDVTESAIHKTRLHKSDEATIYSCWCEANGISISTLILPDQISLHMILDIHKECHISFEILLKNHYKQPFILIQNGLKNSTPINLQPGRYKILLKFPELEIASGSYYIDVAVGEPNIKYFDYIEDALSLEVQSPADQLTHWTFSQSTNQGSLVHNCAIDQVDIISTGNK